MRFVKAFFYGLSGLVLVGCGGSGGTTAAGSGTSGTPSIVSVGDAKVSYSGSAKPAVLDYESGLSVSSLTASISSLTLYPAANLSNAPLYFVQNGAIFSYQRGVVQPVFEQASEYVFDADVSRDGHIYFATVTGTPSYVVEKANLDGTGITTLATTNGAGASVRVSPDGTHVVYNGTSGLTVMSNYGTGSVVLDAAGVEGSFSPDGTKIVYIKAVSGYNQVFSIPVGGGTATQITTDSYEHEFPIISPDGTLVFCDSDTGASREIDSYLLTGASKGFGYHDNYFFNVPYASQARFSPDGKYLSASTGTSYGAETLTASITDLAGTYYQTIATATETSWPPFPVTRSFVGSGGVMFPSAQGFIYSQFQPGFASLVAYTSTGTATATVVSNSGTGGTGPVAYDIHASTVTGVKYANGYFQSPVTVPSSSTDVLVSIDTTTGLVTSVAPFDLTRGAPLVKATTASGTVYKARFSSVWNSKGKNIAPGGATQITLDPKHGNIVAVQS